MKSIKTKFILCCYTLLFLYNLNAQDKTYIKSYGLHYWQRLEAFTFSSHNYGLTYAYLAKSKIELCSEVGLNYRPKKNDFRNNYYSAYMVLGTKFYFFKKNMISFETNFLYDFSKYYSDDKQLNLKTGFGFTQPLTHKLRINFNTGLLLNLEYGEFYGGVNITNKF